MTTPKPKAHHFVFGGPDPNGGDITGEMWVIDAQQGNSYHAVASGSFVDGAGVAHGIKHGAVSGFKFVSKKRGAPRTKAERDVAVYLAWQAYLAGSNHDKERQAWARTRVLELWEARGWGGFVIESHVKSAIERGRKTLVERLGDFRTVIYREHEGCSFEWFVLSVKQEHLAQTSDGRVLVNNGLCCLWRDDWEIAVIGAHPRPFIFPDGDFP